MDSYSSVKMGPYSSVNYDSDHDDDVIVVDSSVVPPEPPSLPNSLPKITHAKYEAAQADTKYFEEHGTVDDLLIDEPDKGVGYHLNPIDLEIVKSGLNKFSDYFYIKKKKTCTINSKEANLLCTLLNNAANIIDGLQGKYWHFNFEEQELARDCMVEIFIDNIIEEAINRNIDEENAELEKIVMY